MAIALTIKKDTPGWLTALRRFWRSPLFHALLLTVSAAAMALSQYLDFLRTPSTPAKEGLAGTVVVIGAAILLALLLAILVTDDDILSTTTPFLLLTVLVSSCYDGYALFAPYIPLAIPAAAALIFHFVRYHGRLSCGTSTAPLFAVSVAVTVGGIGCLKATEYFNPATLYYIAGLGFGMLMLYLLLRASLTRPRDYDMRLLLVRALYLVGIFAALFTFTFYAVRIEWLISDLKRLGHPLLFSIDNRNVYATFLLFALPMPFYYAVKKSGWHLLSALFFYTALLASGSRGGLVCGTALLALCFIYLLRRDVAHRRRNIIILALLALCALAAGGLLVKFFTERFQDGFIVSDEPRVLLLKRALSDFLSHPVFGVGLGYTGNADIYNPKAFAMNWYHMMIPQIAAGLGIVGVLAYTFLFWRRGKLMLRRGDALSRTLALSYIGLFLMSQVNPGEFCPMPYAFLGMLIFLLLEIDEEKDSAAAATKAENALKATLHTALWGAPLTLPENIDYTALLALAEAHMIHSVVGEGLGVLAEDALPESTLQALQDKTLLVLRHNELLASARNQLLDFLAAEHIPAAILKGDGVARLYPTPDLRVSGDIDLLLAEGDLPRAETHLLACGYHKSDMPNDHHTVLKKGNVKIELHLTPAGIPMGEMGERVTALLADTLDTARHVALGGACFPIPALQNQAIILLLHMQQHLREGGLGLRQLMDWTLFLANDLTAEAHVPLAEALAEIGLLRFAEAVTTAAVRHLGLAPEKSPFDACDSALADALFADILAAGNFGRANANFAGSAIVTLHGKREKSSLATALAGVKEKCLAEWQIAEKHRALLIFLVPFWIVRRMLRAPVKPLSMLRSASARAALYDKLSLFKKD
ncbi:MAG: nucleotidyltransferase family protein [Clostridia bacterium]|nr:nucleotidyltransferase family protein [Clostridia bacterium]